MKDTLFNIRQIVLSVIFILAFSLMGMMTQRPIMVAVYAGVLIIISGIIFIFVRINQRHSEISLQKNQVLSIIFGAVLFILALITPLLLVLKSNVINIGSDPSIFAILAVPVTTILFIALIAVAVYLINYQGEHFVIRAAGYLIVILTSLVPGILMSFYDKTASTIGSIYYVALAVLILAYNGINLFLPKD